MPQVWTPDDLLFADIRAARFEPAEQVAGDLLAAASQPRSRLKGVTADEASSRAADLLISAGDRQRAAIIARRVLQGARGRSGELEAACLLARAGEPDAAEALAARAQGSLRDRPGESLILDSIVIATSLAVGEQFELATRVADEATAAYGRWKAGPGRHADRNGTLGEMAEAVRRFILTVHRDFQDWMSGRRADEPGTRPPTLPPWPALSGPCLLWWPEAEYQRVVRQLPDLRPVLGATWRDHTATVESAMLALAGPASLPDGKTAYSLMAADFGHFCGYLRQTSADPRLATTMTGFTAWLISRAEIDARIRQPVPWPPAERSRCWCDSRARYSRCCRRHG
jgi:hypothetical protein